MVASRGSTAEVHAAGRRRSAPLDLPRASIVTRRGTIARLSRRRTRRQSSTVAVMRPAARVGLVVLGTAMAVYGVASLTGGWLGTPPWAYRVHTIRSLDRAPGQPPPEAWCEEGIRDRPAIGTAVGIAGLALVAVGAWPRRGRRGATPAEAP